MLFWHCICRFSIFRQTDVLGVYLDTFPWWFHVFLISATYVPISSVYKVITHWSSCQLLQDNYTSGCLVTPAGRHFSKNAWSSWFIIHFADFLYSLLYPVLVFMVFCFNDTGFVPVHHVILSSSVVRYDRFFFCPFFYALLIIKR